MFHPQIDKGIAQYLKCHNSFPAHRTVFWRSISFLSNQSDFSVIRKSFRSERLTSVQNEFPIVKTILSLLNTIPVEVIFQWEERFFGSPNDCSVVKTIFSTSEIFSNLR
jgi:hypothetical protein